MKKLNLLITITFVLFSGCQQSTNRESLGANDEITNLEMVNENNESLNNEQIANHLANVASRIPDVNDAVAIIAGPYAVVGINIDKDVDRGRVGTIKYTVNEALQQDPFGKTTIVVADADIMERIRGMNEQIQQGYPIQGIITELSEIVARYMPDFPIEENRPENNNRQDISPKHENELKNIEKEQSNR